MLEQILSYIHNYFEKEVIPGVYSVTSGSIQVDFLQNNQYFRIVGSVFNDGVYQYPTSELTDETFDGEIWAMAIPPAVIALVADIEEWQTKYGGVNGPVMSPFQSESFGGYNYSKGVSSDGSAVTWRSVFANRLNEWRKIS